MKWLFISIVIFVIVGAAALSSASILNDSNSEPSDDLEVAPLPSASPESQNGPPCPDQWVYIPGRKRCVPAARSCAPTEKWDRLRERCVPRAPDIPEPVEQPQPRPPLPSELGTPTADEQRCMKYQARLTDAIVEASTAQAELSQCLARGESPSETGRSPCQVAELRVSSTASSLNMAQSNVRIHCP